jgi:hypothetical protein
LLLICLSFRVQAQSVLKDWNISASYGEQRVKMTSVNALLVNGYVAPYPAVNADVKSSSVTNISVGKKLNDLFGIGLTYSRISYHSKSYYTFTGHYHTDSVDFVSSMGAVGSLDIRSNMIGIKPYFALHHFLGTDSVFIYRNFRLYLACELGYGWSDLRMKFNHNIAEPIIDLSNFQDLDMRAGGLYAAPSLRLEYLMNQGSKYGIYLGLEAGYRYFRTGRVHGKVYQWSQLDMDFTGWYWAPGLKVSF